MKTISVMFGLLASAAAQGCGSLVTKKNSATCDPGYILADTDTVQTCSRTICVMMDEWEIVHGADVGKSLKGTGYGCYLESSETPAGDVVCMPAPAPPTGFCSEIILTDDACPVGSSLINLEQIKDCRQHLCDELEWGYGIGSDDDVMLSGGSYGCQLLPFNQSASPRSLCTPVMPPPPPPSTCEPFSLSSENSSTCEDGTFAVDFASLQECRDFLCDEHDFEYLVSKEHETMLVKANGTCYFAPYEGENATQLCRAPPATCGILSLGNSTCEDGTTWIDLSTMENCTDYLCDEFDFEYLISREMTEVLLKNATGCFLESYDGQVNATQVCTPSGPTPSPPSPTPSPPTPSPSPPNETCGNLTLGDSTCEDGTTWVDLSTMVGCTDYLCDEFDFEYLISREMTEVLLKNATGCFLESYDGQVNATQVCTPSGPTPEPTPEPTPVPTPAPPSDNCSALTVSNGSTCEDGTYPVDVKTMEDCMDYLCDDFDFEYLVSREMAAVIVKTPSTKMCYLTTYSGQNAKEVCSTSPPPTPEPTPAPPTPSPSPPNETCGNLTLGNSTCEDGYSWIDLSTMVDCTDYLCDEFDFKYLISREMTEVLLKNATGCFLESYDGQDNATQVCQELPTPVPTPAPTQPQMCLVLTMGTPNCSVGIDLDTLISCKEFLCDEFNFDYLISEERTTVLSNKSAGCQLEFFYDQEVTEVCTPGTPSPTPQPTPSPPSPTPAPNDTCTVLSVGNSTCGTEIDLGTLESCAEYLCAEYDFEYLISREMTMVLTNRSSGCSLEPFASQNVTEVCFDTTPVPTPMPTPTPNDTCVALTVGNSSCGMEVDLGTLQSCSEYLCDEYDFEYLISSDNTSVLSNRSNGCELMAYDGQYVMEVCMDVTPVPTPTPDTPTPTPMPIPPTASPSLHHTCSPIEVSDVGCANSTEPVLLPLMEECKDFLCAEFDFDYVMGQDEGTVLTGRSLGCKIIPYTNQAASTLCSPPVQKKSSSGLSGGVIFVIVLFSLIGGYLVGGTIFNAVRGKRGFNMVPNANTWRKVGHKIGFVKGGELGNGYTSIQDNQL